MNSRSVAELHIAVFLFGLAGLFGKLIDAAPQQIAFARTFVAAVALLAILQFSRSPFASSRRQDLFLIVVAGILLAGHWVTFFHAIQISSVAIGLIGFAVFPIFVMLMEPLLFDLRYRRIDVACAVGVAAGLVVVVPSFSITNIATRGMLWALVSGFLFALLTLINRRTAAANEFRAVAAVQYGVASVCLLPFVLTSNTAGFGQKELLLLLILGSVFTALPHTLFIKALAEIKAGYASVVVGLEPVYGIVFAAVILHEIPTMRTLLGASLVIAAVVVASNAARLRQSEI